MNPINKEFFIIKGLSGKKLTGAVKINGAKNAALKAMAAAVLFDGPVTLNNIPDTNDVGVMSDVLVKLGAKVKKTSPNTFIVDPTSINQTDIDKDLAQNMRASVVLTGPLLARYKKVSFPSPGGCVIGTRPIDMFIEGYKKMGAMIDPNEEAVYSISAKNGVTGADVFFNIQTVGGTETLMMAAVLGKGKTILRNCAMEPEILNVAEWLNAAGAKISGAGTTTIVIEGTAGKLLDSKVTYTTIPDRIEAGSFLILGAACAEELTIKDCRPDHLESVINLLKDSGAVISTAGNSITVKAAKNPKPFNIRTHEYPGFPTDLQAPIVTYLTQAHGESIVFETIFEGRFKYVEDLSKMGANIITMNPREILIKGPTPLVQFSESDELRAHDIRAGFALVMAALMSNGNFTVNNIHLIDRGYEKLEEKLKDLGAEVIRNKES